MTNSLLTFQRFCSPYLPSPFANPQSFYSRYRQSAYSVSGLQSPPEQEANTAQNQQCRNSDRNGAIRSFKFHDATI